MSRINTNVTSLYAQQGLSKSQGSLSSTLQRLSTGLKINSGADDPSGLIASQQLKAEIAGITQAVSNSQRANNVIATAEGALNEVSNLLQSVKGLIVQAANSGAMSADEIKANQLQLDSAVQSITRISETTTFAGLHLIDGSLDYLTSGVSKSAISALSISQANFGTNPNLPVQLNVLTSARQANLEFTASSIGTSVTLEVSGNQGTQTLTFTSGTAASAIAYAINTVSDSTGVRAKLTNLTTVASGITFVSDGFGTNSFVSVQAQKGTFTTKDTLGNQALRVVGRDAVATVNGALTTGDGLNLKLNTSSLDLNLTLDKTFGAGKSNFAITGGGALFQLGAEVSSNQQVSIGIQSVAANKLGNADVGFLSDVVTGGSSSLVAGNAASASKIISTAINEVSVFRGRLGAFQQSTLNTNISSLGIALENVTSANSSIADADFAAETANLTRSQILVQAGTSVLSTANSSPQTVLSLLK
jgi:flagellin